MTADPRDPGPGGGGAGHRRRHHAEAGTRALLAAFTVGDPEEQLRLEDLLAGLGKRVFGMLLFIAAIRAFILVPGIAGANSGPLTAVLGIPLLAGRRRTGSPR